MGFSDDDIEKYLQVSDAASMCSASYGIAEIKGIPVGAVRTSIGYLTTIEDCDKYVDFIKEYIE